MLSASPIYLIPEKKKKNLIFLPKDREWNVVLGFYKSLNSAL